MLRSVNRERGENRPAENERRLEQLYAAHADAVMTYLRHRTDHETAKDVLSETFVTTWRKLDEVPPQPRGWLFAVARRVLANHVRSQGRAGALIEKVAADPATAIGSSELQEAMTRHDIVSALNALEEPDREVLLLAGWYELSGREAAQALGCSQSAYGVRLHRARRRLRAVLEDPPAGSTRAATTQQRTAKTAFPTPATARPEWEAHR
jgi:RNA polymerase sigma-70 factor (ECF subfamily)